MTEKRTKRTLDRPGENKAVDMKGTWALFLWIQNNQAVGLIYPSVQPTQ